MPCGTADPHIPRGKNPPILVIIRDAKPSSLLHTARSMFLSLTDGPQSSPTRWMADTSRVSFLSVQHLYRTGIKKALSVYSVPTATTLSDGG